MEWNNNIIPYGKMRAWISNSFALGLHQSFGASCADMGEDAFCILKDSPSAACRPGIIINVPKCSGLGGSYMIPSKHRAQLSIILLLDQTVTP